MQFGGLPHANTKDAIIERGGIPVEHYPTYYNQRSGRPNPVASQSIVRELLQQGKYKTKKAVIRLFRDRTGKQPTSAMTLGIKSGSQMTVNLSPSKSPENE